MATTPEVEVKAAQRTKAKRATLDMLIGKLPNKEEFTVALGTAGERISFLFVAIGATEYDELLTEHPPTAEQKVGGASYNINTFAPALLARVCREPGISVGDWNNIWTSPAWGRGELMGLFFKAANICSKDIDPSPTAAG